MDSCMMEVCVVLNYKIGHILFLYLGLPIKGNSCILCF